MNAPVAAGVCGIASHVHLVLPLVAYPKIAAAVVERVAVDVVNQHPRPASS